MCVAIRNVWLKEYREEAKEPNYITSNVNQDFSYLEYGFCLRLSPADCFNHIETLMCAGFEYGHLFAYV